MAQFLYDRGRFCQLQAYESCAFLPYRKTIRTIIVEEAGHQNLGERIVVELCRTGDYEDVKQPMFETWLRQGMLSFGRPGTDGDRYAVDVGLKKRGAAEVMQDFINDIKPAVKASGLVFPDPKKIGLVVPDTLDFSLEGVDEAKAQGFVRAA
jgi:1,2-phenylacetyl-CoA epoxidase catalytic subunit